MHVCLTVECITSGLHWCVFLIRSPPPPPQPPRTHPLSHPRPLKDWAKFSARPLADQKKFFSLAPVVKKNFSGPHFLRGSADFFGWVQHFPRAENPLYSPP